MLNKLLSKFLTLLFLLQYKVVGAPPQIEDYGKNLFLGSITHNDSSLHQLLGGRVIDSAYEDVTSVQYSFLYTFKYFNLGFEALYNDIIAKDFLEEIAAETKVDSVIPKNQYGAVLSWVFAQNVMNLLNWKYFKFDLSVDVSAGQSYDNSHEQNSYTTYGLKIKSDEIWKKTSLIFKFQGNTIYSDSRNIHYSQYFAGLGFNL